MAQRNLSGDRRPSQRANLRRRNILHEAKSMLAARLHKPGTPLVLETVADPEAGPGEIIVQVRACAVCRTDLHIVDGELPLPMLPLIPGHEVIGQVVGLGPDVSNLEVGDRVGLAWLAWSCGRCAECRRGQENLCAQARFTGYTQDGGYAQFARAQAAYSFRVPGSYDAAHAAPLMCAGLIGHRAFSMAGSAQKLGFYGFGAAAHLLVQVATQLGREVFAFTRPGDATAQRFARELGAVWAGDSTQPAPEPLDAALIFAPVGSLVPTALRAVRVGGVVICAGIHMSDIPSFPYELLWHERVIRSVANLTRKDALDFLALAERVPLRTEVEVFPLQRANDVLSRLRAGQIRGAAVLQPEA
jgi:propanol-preferring alcohol dehydrogenase